MKRVLSIGFMLLAFTACAHSNKTKKHKKKKHHTTAAAGTTITQVKMNRSACFGRCPQYELTINSNGLVQYHGVRFTQHDGTYERQFPQDSVLALFREFDSYHVDTCSSKYNKMIADVPGMGFVITRGSAVQHINNANFGPGFLKTLANEADNFGQVNEGWKMTEAPPTKQ